MATKEKRGWIWTDDEKAWIGTWKRKLKSEYDYTSKQIERFRKGLPKFANEATKAAQPFMELAKILLLLADGSDRRKYQSLSCGEAKLKLRDIEDRRNAWIGFLKRKDVQDAIKEVNKKMQAKKRQHYKQVREAESKAIRYLNSDEFSKILDGKVSELIKSVSGMVSTARAIIKYGNNRDAPILERLLLVHFVRSAFDFKPREASEMEQFVKTEPRSMKEILRQTLYLLMKCYILFAIKDSEIYRSIRSSMGGDSAGAHLAEVSRSLMNSMKEWKKEKVSPRDISKGYFTIFNIDCSLEAKPE